MPVPSNSSGTKEPTAARGSAAFRAVSLWLTAPAPLILEAMPLP